jgi:hydrogenase maturation protein HypF
MAKERKCLEIIGIVQGVGFRPFIYRLAKRHNLKGFVLNNTKGVIVELEGEGAQIEEVISKIKENPPPLAQIEKIECESLPVLEYRDFEIRISRKTEEKNTLEIGIPIHKLYQLRAKIHYYQGTALR